MEFFGVFLLCFRRKKDRAVLGEDGPALRLLRRIDRSYFVAQLPVALAVR